MTLSLTVKIACFAVIGLGLAGCTEETMTISTTAPTPAEQACLAAVSNAANNGDVTVLEALGSEAGTQVTVGVGPDRASWNCIAYSDGTTAGVQFNGSNG